MVGRQYKDGPTERSSQWAYFDLMRTVEYNRNGVLDQLEFFHGANGIDYLIPKSPQNTNGQITPEKGLALHKDTLGSPAVVTKEETGDVAEKNFFSPFGDTVVRNATADYPVSKLGNPILYTGQYYDPVAELYLFPYRAYDPQIGKFLQRDPIGYADGPNATAYVGNAPYTKIDPLGLAGEEASVEGYLDYIVERGHGDPYAGVVKDFKNEACGSNNCFMWDMILPDTTWGVAANVAMVVGGGIVFKGVTKVAGAMSGLARGAQLGVRRASNAGAEAIGLIESKGPFVIERTAVSNVRNLHMEAGAVKLSDVKSLVKGLDPGIKYVGTTPSDEAVRAVRAIEQRLAKDGFKVKVEPYTPSKLKQGLYNRMKGYAGLPEPSPTGWKKISVYHPDKFNPAGGKLDPRVLGAGVGGAATTVGAGLGLGELVAPKKEDKK
ncbi:MAG: RHS repeat-associated core domain-containing protein [Deltaproteobacteria bacterium]|nr:RHS repeat-associated core domain-containing protein [Deltaproteobacteria bacterium]